MSKFGSGHKRLHYGEKSGQLLITLSEVKTVLCQPMSLLDMLSSKPLEAYIIYPSHD